MPYQLLALDMDGTLLDSSKRILPLTREALRKLAGRGTPVAYCTGRCVKELMDYPTELPFIRYGVLSSGAVIYDFVHGEPLEVHALSTDDILRAMELAAPQHPMTHIMSVDASVVRTGSIEIMPSVGMSVYVPMFERICTMKDDLVAWIKTHEGEIVKVNFYHRTPEARLRTRVAIEAVGLPIMLANAEETSLECSAPGINKGEGLRALGTRLGIDSKDMVAIGDSYNDIESLSIVGMPVAMGNAPEEIKAIARLVVADNDHDGIAEAVGYLF